MERNTYGKFNRRNGNRSKSMSAEVKNDLTSTDPWIMSLRHELHSDESAFIYQEASASKPQPTGRQQMTNGQRVTPPKNNFVNFAAGNDRVAQREQRMLDIWTNSLRNDFQFNYQPKPASPKKKLDR